MSFAAQIGATIPAKTPDQPGRLRTRLPFHQPLHDCARLGEVNSESSATISLVDHRLSAKRASNGSASSPQKPRDFVNRA